MRKVIFPMNYFGLFCFCINEIKMKKILFLLLIFNFSAAFGQTFETDLQIRPRFEYRNGYKTLLNETQEPAAFVSQRSRLTLDYVHEKLLVKLSAQNIHVWGNVPTMRLEDVNGIALFEAFGQYRASENLMFRLGRQVLSYDNQRILGEVDWAQQGQSHDAALVSWLPKQNHRFDLGAAYNAPVETLAKIPYEVNSYQNLQFAWYHMGVNNVGFSFLFMNTGYEYNGLRKREIDYLQTYGAFHKFNSGRFTGDVAVYGQTGARNDHEVAAWYAGINLNYILDRSWRVGAGAEFLSGTNMNSTTDESYSFTPLFGTNHKFNGFMDYFFVGNHQNSVGLLDIYGRLTFSSPKFELSVTPHAFSSAANVVDATGEIQEDYLGTEIDLAGVYKVQKDLSVGFGYSQMFGTESLEVLKGGNSSQTQNWAWVMVNFSPKIFSFTK